jgi:hypothetical protein
MVFRILVICIFSILTIKAKYHGKQETRGGGITCKSKRQLNKYLGSTYMVEASVGHIKDLITYRLGVEIEKDFEPKICYNTRQGRL